MWHNATKQQERDALEKVRAIVKTLGPQSYIGTAFEGCFEDAESNIENDFADSYKRRLESAEEKIDRLSDELEDSKKDYEAADAFFMSHHYREAAPSMYDCTGQIFTTWYKIFKRHGQFWVYHATAMDV
ncbi:MAG: hypothetical protein IJA35_04945 [Clostridia bacterium]|nr:hypothetical protein [Clostridia bacterium]